MTDSQVGTFVWRELMTPDTAKSVRFYGELCGWNITPIDMGPGQEPYQLVHREKGSRDIGGIMKTGPGMPAAWCSYVGVEDVDATSASANSAGGKVLKEPSDIPNVGRFSVLADPDGAVFVAFKGSMPRPVDGSAGDRPKLGDFCWEQLSAGSIEKANAFYTKVLGWRAEQGGDGLGPVFHMGERMIASAMPTQPGVPPNWMTFVVVDDLSGANARVTRLGGSVLMPRIEVPGMGAFSVIKDDVGAVIGLFVSA